MITLKEYTERIVNNVGKVIIGKDDVIRKVVVCFLAEGHVLLEDLPGTGKTMLLRAFAATVGGKFSRIQFTPDLLPSDLTGISFYNQKVGEFVFREGPLFANIVLADEINRATPRTQSALLEAMEEKQISVDGQTYKLDTPFMVMGSQNPLENYGTFPLPEAQLDRFFMKLTLGYPERQQEISLLDRPNARSIIDSLKPVITNEETKEVIKEADAVNCSEDVSGYLMNIVEATRKDPLLAAGVSTRGTLALYRACQITAAMGGRNYIIPEDVKANAQCVLAHRLLLASGSHQTPEVLLNRIISEIQVPLENL